MPATPDSDAPLSAGGIALTIASKQRDEERDERRRAMLGLFGMGVFAWPSFFIPDYFADQLHGGHHLVWLLGWRALGTLVGLTALIVVRRNPDISGRAILAIDLVVFAIGSALIAIISIPSGGLATRSMQGVMLLTIVRATYVPSRWTRGILLSAPTVLAFPVTMAVAAIWDPLLRAQWTNRNDLGVFLYDLLFVVAGAVLGAIGSHLLYTARRQVWEARKLGNYRLKARIGSGAMGDVWLARHDPLDRPVALKVLHERAARDEGAVRRFIREARAASRLRHPNTIRVFDFGASDDGVFYIAMEILDGLDLETIVSTGGPLTNARVIRFARQICGSLAEAHDLGIVHRDVKPANLFVTQYGDEYDFVKVLDFGVAQIARDATMAKSGGDGEVVGTPAYLSPEMALGESVIDARSDIYSLGAVLYFLATGTPLFPDRSFRDTLLAHAMHDPQPPSARADGIAPDLERIILKCLAKQPAYRYQTARDVDAALAACEDAGKWDNEAARRYWTSLRPSIRLRTQSDS
ncbi:MAG: serine/threonine-protein kinase [Polyangiaceae bacterium]